MKIALLGYGKMGHEIEVMAIGLGHTIELIINNEDDWSLKSVHLKECDVAIEFTTPEKVIDNIGKCFALGVPIVVGTTGWHKELAKISEECLYSGNTLFYASNFSIGVNIFFAVNRHLSALLEAYPIYEPSMVETHHIHKLDKPSGTAIKLANDIIASNPRYHTFTNDTASADEILIESLREGNVTGKHTVTWDSDIDSITITHEAKNRQGFAAGALMAAKWVQGRKGVFTMKDMLGL